MTPAFRCTGLNKSYRDFHLGPLDMELEPGVVLGYIGPNGSGKTTTMNCLTGLVRPEAGEVEICGSAVDPADPLWKTDVAFVTDRQPFYEKWSGARNLQFLSGFYSAWSANTVADLARRFDLPLDTRVRDLSRGNRVKLTIVADLVEEWRSITFRLATDPPQLRGAVHCERSDDDHRTVSCDGVSTIAHLGEIGTEHVRPAPMGIDEIAVQILKGGYRVATG